MSHPLIKKKKKGKWCLWERIMFQLKLEGSRNLCRYGQRAVSLSWNDVFRGHRKEISELQEK